MEKDFSEKPDAWLEGIVALGTHHADKGAAIAEIKRRDCIEQNALTDKNLQTAKIAAIASAVSDWIK